MRTPPSLEAALQALHVFVPDRTESPVIHLGQHMRHMARAWDSASGELSAGRGESRTRAPELTVRISGITVLPWRR